MDRLSYAGNEAARRYLDGEIDARGAADWLKVRPVRRPRAEQRIRFIDQYRSYVINYNLGQGHGGRARGRARGHGRRSGEAVGGLRASCISSPEAAFGV